ncbi:MAG: HAMP domain-containing histidine kinase, partial [Flavobacteriales bacterium]|nr:HAMP domain-containing histidine kinase [Flavobacteriales bacterium]
CTDIEKIKQAENQIRNSEVFNRSVVNSLSAHLAVVNDKGDIVSINEAWKRFALENCETSMKRTGVGSNYFEVCEKAFINGDEIAGRVLQGMKNVLNKKIEDFYLEYPCHSPSEQRWFGLRIAKFEGDEPLILLAHTNLTDRILAERERQKITDDLIHRNRDLEQFTYIVSHNLRAPVANIKGLSDILGDETLSIAEAGSVVKDLLSSVSKLDSVILDLNDILQLKIDVDRAKERVVFEELVKGVKESIHSLVVSEKVTIETRFDEVPEMFTLKSYLYSIFYNLISNSIKYKRSDAQLLIEIKSFRKKETIELVFKDNGKGIDLNKSRDQVFGLYKRFHRDIEGKGMGLFMVKTQVEALGGTISIESEVNKGTTFKILFTN